MQNVIYVTPAEDLQAVFDKAPEHAEIRLAPGEYRQKTIIRTPGLTVIGAGADRTKLVWNDYARMRDALGAQWNTFRTYTLAVCADGVTIRNLTVENDARMPEVKGQEVALSVVATDFYMEDCRLVSTQDTLFVGPLPSDLIGRYEGFLLDDLRRGYWMRQRFVNCRIEGTVDFLFGSGETLFENCELRSMVDARGCGYVAAPSHAKQQKEGFLFRNCRFTCEPGVKNGSVYLARPWRDYGLCRFQNCVYDVHIAPAGFDQWSGTNRNETARFFEVPEISGRVNWCNRPE